MALPRVAEEHLVSLFYELLRHDTAFRRWRHLMLEPHGSGIVRARPGVRVVGGSCVRESTAHGGGAVTHFVHAQPPEKQVRAAMENLNRVVAHLSTRVELAAGGDVAALTTDKVEQIVREGLPEVDLEPHDPARDVFTPYAEHPGEDMLFRQLMRALSQDVKASMTFASRV